MAQRPEFGSTHGNVLHPQATVIVIMLIIPRQGPGGCDAFLPGPGIARENSSLPAMVMKTNNASTWSLLSAGSEDEKASAINIYKLGTRSY